MSAFRKRRSAGLRITVAAKHLARDGYADSRPDDEAQWFYLRCLRALQPLSLGTVRHPVVADLGRTIEFTGRIAVPNGITLEVVLDRIRQAIPDAAVSLTDTPVPAAQKLAA